MDAPGVVIPTLAILTTLINEHDTVTQTVQNTTDQPGVVSYLWAHSGGWATAVPTWATKTFKPSLYLPLSNLDGDLNRYELPARAISRNYATLFGTLRQAVKHGDMTRPDYVVALTGDTLLRGLEGIHWIIAQMKGQPGAVLGVAKCTGGEFHSADKTADHLRCNMGGGRLQHIGSTDFMPQLFVVNYDFVEKGGLCDIPVTNRWTSEQCLGDAAIYSNGKPAGQFVFSHTAYGFNKGVEYHVK